MEGELTVPSRELRAVVEALRDKGFDHVKSIAGIDYPEEGVIELVYHISSYLAENLVGKIVVLRTKVDRRKPDIDSISDIFPSAKYIELDTRDLFGVPFKGNDYPDPFILPEELKGSWPLRKDYTIPEEDIE